MYKSETKPELPAKPKPKSKQRFSRIFDSMRYGTARSDGRGWFLNPRQAQQIKPAYEDTDKVILASTHKKMHRGETLAEFRARRKACNKRRRVRDKQQ